MELKVERIQVQPMDDKRLAVSVFYHGLESPQIFSPPATELSKLVADFLNKAVTRHSYDLSMLESASAAEEEEAEPEILPLQVSQDAITTPPPAKQGAPVKRKVYGVSDSTL